MAITITAKLDASGVKSGANEAAAAVDGLGQATGSAAGQMQDDLAGTLGELDDLKGEVEQLQAELDKMGGEAEQAFYKVGSSATEAGDAVKSIGGGAAESRDKIQTIAVSYLAVVDVVKKVGAFARKAGEAITWMAENGNPAAIELQDSFKQVKQSILDIAEDPSFQDMLGDIAVAIREDVIPAIKAIPDAWVSSQDWLEDGIVGLGESLGVFAEGTREVMDEMQAADSKDRALRQSRLAAQKEERASKDSLSKVEEALANIEKAKTDAAIKSTMEQINSEEELRDVIDDLTESIREQAKAGSLSDEERERGLKKIAAAEDRYRQVKSDNEKRVSDELVKIAADAAAERERIAQEEADKKQRIAQEALDQERRNIAERKRLILGGDTKGAEQLLGSQTRQQVKEAFAQRKADEAAGAFDASGATQAEVSAQRKRAVAMARRQFDQGTANPEEVRAAQVDLASQAADSAVAQGKSSKETAQATKEAIAELARTQNELEQVQAEMANMRQLMGGISRQGERRRAQVAGSRQ